MNIVKHNPYKDKLPIGAVKTNHKLFINIYIDKNQSPYDCQCLVRSDDTGEITSHLMTAVIDENNIIQFNLELSFDKVGLYYYFFSYCSNGEYFYVGKGEHGATIGSFLPQWQLTIYDENFSTPSWIHGGIMYQIFPDRFSRADTLPKKTAKQPRKIVDNWYSTPEFIYDNPEYKADDFYMGNIQGIIQKLDYLQELNISVIYLNPIFESAENHRYSTADYMNIDPYLGSEEDFQELICQCNQRNIKILLDGVFSHTGADSIYFNKFNNYDSVGAYNSAFSPYYSWYKFQEYPEKYESWWNFTTLPNVNEEDPHYLDFITNKEQGVLSHWLKKGVSGYRLDVIDEIPDLFLDKLRATVKANNPENLIIGEVWEDATTKEAYGKRRRYLLGNQMDSVMNYPWKEAIIQLVQTQNTEAFYQSIMTIIANYPKETLNCLMNILSSHDTMRIITQLGETRHVLPENQGKTFLEAEMKEKAITLLKQAAFLQFTLPGVPSIYYGDEVGLEGYKDPYCRRGYPWGKENQTILEFYKTLTKVRSENKDAFSSDLEFIHIDTGVLIYKRGDLHCLINLTDKSHYIDITLQGEILLSIGAIELTKLGIILENKSLHILKTNKE